MSTKDSVNDRRKRVDERQIEESEFDRRSLIADASEVPKSRAEKAVRRRKDWNPTQAQSRKFQRYIPEGYAHRLVDPANEDRMERLQEQDWVFAKDENGEKVLAKVNYSVHGMSTHHFLMLKPQEWFDDDAKKAAKARTDNLKRNKQGKKLESSVEGMNIVESGLTFD